MDILSSPRAVSDFASGGKARTGSPPAGHSPITVTGVALRKILEAKEELGLPVKGLRVTAHPRSPLRADFTLRFVPSEEPVSGVDSVQSVEGIDLYIAPDSAAYLDGATIDYLFTLVSADFKVRAPLRKLDTPDGRTALRIERVLEEEVIPSLATHGGGALLIDFREGVVFLELTGGCQGCSLAWMTLKQGIETTLRSRLPEISEVLNVTQHAKGRNPFAR